VRQPLRLLIWSSIPTHHQSAFFAALRARDIDLRVHYFQRVPRERLNMGWSEQTVLPAGECYSGEVLPSAASCPDWRERIHIVPGYGCRFLLRLAWYLARERQPWVHWSEHSWPTLRAHLTFAVKRAYGELVRRRALGAFAIGELARQEFIRWGVPAERIRFLPYAVAGVAEPQTVWPPARAARFVFLGQLIPRKGIDLLLAAMPRVLALCPAVRLELAGTDRSGGAYARSAAGLGLTAAVDFSGVIAAGAIGAVLARADVLVLPSRHDGWGVVLNEAASAGKALIASDACGAAHHLIVPGVNGFRFPSGDVAALARAMLEYCHDAQLAQRHGAASLRLFEEFTPARNALRLEEGLQSLLPADAGTQAARAQLHRADA
jgi:glycosyltransferase involved in cell wall biosynthesis